MSRERWRIMPTLCAATICLSLTGCASLWPPPYGQIAVDADSVREDGLPYSMPANAPSTLNGHWADYDGHQGIDVLGPIGMPVLAPAAGTVVASYLEPMYGHRVVIEHGTDDDGVVYRSVLMHLDTRLVEVGQRVERGQQVARLGRTGLLAGGIPHLHFEIQTRLPRRGAIFETRNPNRFWADGPGRVTCYRNDIDYRADLLHTTYPVPCRGEPWR